MAGRVILIALSCAISGLLVISLMSTECLVPVQKKSRGIGSFSSSADDLHSKTGRVAEAIWRFSQNTAPNGHDPSKQQHREKQQMISERLAGKEKQHDPTFMVPIEFFMKKQKVMEGAVFVDVRDHDAFQKCHIPESINVPLYALKTKKFLGSMVLVLANEGFHCAHLEEQCRQLKGSGLMVWVLEGGLNAWREAGAPLEGERLAQNDLNRLSPRDLFEERYHDHWIAVDVRKSKKSKETLPFAKVIRVGTPENAEEFIAPLVKFLKKEKKQSPLFFVVFNEDGKQYERAEKMIGKAGIKNAFYLKDGLEGYKTFLAQRAVILRKEDHSGKTVGKCARCP